MDALPDTWTDRYGENCVVDPRASRTFLSVKERRRKKTLKKEWKEGKREGETNIEKRIEGRKGIEYQHFFHQLRLSPFSRLFPTRWFRVLIDTIDTLTPKLDAANRSEAETADEADVCA